MTTTMTTTTKLTANEEALLLAWPCNYREAESEKSDNASWAEVANLAKATGLPVRTVRGVLGSLAKKGLAEGGHEKANGVPGDLQVLTDAGIDTAFGLRAAQHSDREVPAAPAPASEPTPEPAKTKTPRSGAAMTLTIGKAEAAKPAPVVRAAARPLPFTPKPRVAAPAEVRDNLDSYRFFAASDTNWRIKPTGKGFAFVAWLIKRGDKGATLAEAAKANHLAVHLRWDLERNADKLRWEPLPAAPAKDAKPAPAGK